MKTLSANILWPRVHGLSIFLLVSVLVLSSPTARAGEPPQVSQLISNVLHSTTPGHAYQTTVNQTISTPSALTASVVQSAPATRAQSFGVTYDRGQFSHLSSITQTGAAQASTQSSPSNAADIQVAINLAPFLQRLQSWPIVSVTLDTPAGRAAYKVEAASGQSVGCTLWIDAEHWYVSKAIVILNGKQFAQAVFEYRNVDGFWLLSKVVIDHASDGTRVTQVFGEYATTSIQ